MTMRKALCVELFDVGIILDASAGGDFFTNNSDVRPGVEIMGSELIKFGKILGLDVDANRVVVTSQRGRDVIAEDAGFSIFRADSLAWSARVIEAEIVSASLLSLRIAWDEGENEDERDRVSEITYCGKFAVWWIV